jgi:hypothetical protein
MFLVSSCEPCLSDGCFAGAVVVVAPWFECVNYIVVVAICDVWVMCAVSLSGMFDSRYFLVT